jgi:hypothetical protein
MNHRQIEQKLRSVDGLQSVEMTPVSSIASPFFVLTGYVLFSGERFLFKTEVDIREYNSNERVAYLGAMLLASVARANQRHAHTLPN